MKRTIIGQCITSTCVDSQGEQLSPDDLQELLRSQPNRVPLHQQHNFALPVCGEMSNFRIQPDPEDPSHLMMVCDVTYDDELIEGPTGGFSFSAIRDGKANSSDPLFGVYLPFPLYNDASLADSFLTSDAELVVGKWVKKNADPLLIALIVIFLRPFWDTIYKRLLEEKVGNIIDCAKEAWPAVKCALAERVKHFLAATMERWPKSTALNFSVNVPVEFYQPWPIAIFLPARDVGVEGLTSVTEGIEAAKSFCEADWKVMGKRIRRIRLSLDVNTRSYVVIGVEYVDGSHRTFSQK